MADSRTGVLSLVASAAAREAESPAEPALEPGLADVITLQRRKAAALSGGDEQSLFLDTVAEYQWARDTAGLAPATLDGLTKPIIEICGHYGVVPWQLTPRQVDSYFAGVGKRARSTVRRKLTLIDHYFAFLEQRYAGEIAAATGLRSSHRSTRSTGRGIVAITGFGSPRRSERCASSSDVGENRCPGPASP